MASLLAKLHAVGSLSDEELDAALAEPLALVAPSVVADGPPSSPAALTASEAPK
jgi:hypothetical protein